MDICDISIQKINKTCNKNRTRKIKHVYKTWVNKNKTCFERVKIRVNFLK